MNAPRMTAPRSVAPDIDGLGTWLPIPGFGLLAINAFLIHAPQPVLVDTGLASQRTEFLEHLRARIDPEALRWIWITHTDLDHIGNLAAVLELAPAARIVTTYLGMAKLNLAGLPVDRVYLLNPGQSLDIGDRMLQAVSPPCFDAPETTGLFETRNRTLFSADCFGALLEAPAESAAAIEPQALRTGMTSWARVDAPWLDRVEAGAFGRTLAAVRALEPARILGSHLPPAEGMTETLLENLDAARAAPAFAGPDQAALERMLAAA